MRTIALTLLLVFIALASFQYLYTGSPGDLSKNNNPFDIIAHRGVHHDFHKDNLDNHTCTATRIFEPTHSYIENTIESIQAAFDYGATIVEIDIRPTKDNQLIVFHDYRMECRTDGVGNVWDNSLDDLRKIDIGYGYTHDGGKTYPLRGKGIGKIKTLIEILSQFPEKKFLIDNKNGNDIVVAQLIVETLLSLPEEQQRNIYLWTQDDTYEYIVKAVPGVKRLLLPRHHQKKFFISYFISLGFWPIGNQYKNQGIGLPIEYTKYIWGWPYRFLNKVYNADTRFYLFVNSKEDLDRISGIPLDGVVTDHIELLSDYL